MLAVPARSAGKHKLFKQDGEAFFKDVFPWVFDMFETFVTFETFPSATHWSSGFSWKPLHTRSPALIELQVPSFVSPEIDYFQRLWKIFITP